MEHRISVCAGGSQSEDLPSEVRACPIPHQGILAVIFVPQIFPVRFMNLDVVQKRRKIPIERTKYILGS